MANRRRVALYAAACALVGGLGTTAVAEEARSIFGTLEVLERAESQNEASARTMRDDVTELDQKLEGQWKSVDVALRAARPIRRNVSHSLARWLGAYRAAEREALDGPAAPADTHRLLRYAAPMALDGKFENMDVIRRADEQNAKFQTLLAERARATVALARVDAIAHGAGEVRADVIRTARTEGAAADLEATADALQAVLEGLPGVREGIDFHRRKGTLARPVTMNPENRFGQAAKLARPDGLTYRPEAGRDVHATGGGVVSYVGVLEGWGRVLVLEHGGGYRSVYAHLGDVAVSQGDEVARADVIATAGDSGSLDGVRMYYELRRGLEPVDPEPWIMKY